MLIDTHAHYNSCVMENLKNEIDIVNKSNDITKIINVGLDYKTSEESINIGIENNKFYSTIGIHPLYNGNVNELEYLYNKYDNKKIVAIGETGIDTSGDILKQIDKFIDSIRLANKLKLPLIIHSNTTKDSREYANKICIEIIKKYKPLYGFIFHFFQPDLEILEEIIKLGGYISVGSNITRPRASKSLEVVKNVPIDKLIIETDYPFLTSNPNKTGRETFDKICELKNKEKVFMKRILNSNAESLFYKLK